MSDISSNDFLSPSFLSPSSMGRNLMFNTFHKKTTGHRPLLFQVFAIFQLEIGITVVRIIAATLYFYCFYNFDITYPKHPRKGLLLWPTILASSKVIILNFAIVSIIIDKLTLQMSLTFNIIQTYCIICCHNYHTSFYAFKSSNFLEPHLAV